MAHRFAAKEIQQRCIIAWILLLRAGNMCPSPFWADYKTSVRGLAVVWHISSSHKELCKLQIVVEPDLYPVMPESRIFVPVFRLYGVSVRLTAVKVK